MTRKEGGKFGFAESIPNQKITAFKMESATVDTNNVEEQAEEIITKADPPSEVYVFCFLPGKKAGFPHPVLFPLAAKCPRCIPAQGSHIAIRGNLNILLVLVLTAFSNLILSISKIFLNYCSFATPILHAPGTAQIGEGIENSWEDLEESEREEEVEEEGESEAATSECQRMETEDTSTISKDKGEYSFVSVLHTLTTLLC